MVTQEAFSDDRESVTEYSKSLLVTRKLYEL